MLSSLTEKLLHSGQVYSGESHLAQFWKYAFLVRRARESQFDLLAETSDTNQDLPNGILCCAGSGEGFHGQHDRPWVTLPGNVHISALFLPHQRLANCGIAFTVVAVVTVLQVLDSMGLSRAKVKWVNDILVDEAKVGGVLIHIKTQGEKVISALVGIGLNVEKIPHVEPTPFVPEVAALRYLVEDPEFCTQARVFRRLAAELAKNYDRLLDGNLPELMEIYRRRSIVIGRTVTVFEDSDVKGLTKIASGRVKSIGDNLELKLEGERTPIWRGRLVLEGCNPASEW